MGVESTRNPRIADIFMSVDKYCCDSFEALFQRLKDEGRIAPRVDIPTLAKVFNVLGDGMFWRRAIEPNAEYARGLAGTDRFDRHAAQSDGTCLRRQSGACQRGAPMNVRKIIKSLMMGLLLAGVAAGAGYIFIKKKHTAAIQAQRLEAAKSIRGAGNNGFESHDGRFRPDRGGVGFARAARGNSRFARNRGPAGARTAGGRGRSRQERARFWPVSSPNRSTRSSLKTKPISRTQTRRSPRPRARSCKPKPKRKRPRLSSCAPSR